MAFYPPRSSSPPSSPGTLPDSSPPSSPRSSSAFELDCSPPAHPFAGSAKQVKEPRIHEKKRRISPVSPCDSTPKPSKKYRRYECPPSPGEFDFEMPVTPAKSAEERFREAVSEALLNSRGQIALQGANLTYLPEDAIEDLQKLVVLSARSEQEFADPKLLTRSSKRLSFDRSTSYTFGVPREEIHLILSQNALTFLPPQLFYIERLTFLSLHNNNLRYIPPEIFLLPRLKSLNLANNCLKFLPAEMMNMHLSELLIHPNPFLPPPPSPSPPKRTLSRSGTSKSRLFQDRPRQVSKRECLHDVPTLVEICLRGLFSAYPDIGDAPFHGWQCPTDSLPELVKERLHHGQPGSVQGYVANRPPRDDVTGLGTCPSPRHASEGAKSIFFQHSEERFTWESVIAGVKNLGDVPVRWRGCNLGCLAFLDPPKVAESPSQQPAVPSAQPLALSAPTKDVEPEDAIQPVQTSFGSFTDEDLGE